MEHLVTKKSLTTLRKENYQDILKYENKIYKTGLSSLSIRELNEYRRTLKERLKILKKQIRRENIYILGELVASYWTITTGIDIVNNTTSLPGMMLGSLAITGCCCLCIGAGATVASSAINTIKMQKDEEQIEKINNEKEFRQLINEDDYYDSYDEAYEVVTEAYSK